MDFSFEKKCAGIKEYVLNLKHQRMEQDKLDKAERKAEIVYFFQKHGIKAAVDAFKVSKTSIYRWIDKLRRNNWKTECLIEESKAPINRRKRTVDQSIIDKIKELRLDHPGLGKDKIASLLKYNISASTTGRIIADLKEKSIIPKHTKVSYYAKTDRFVERKIRRKRKLRKKGYKPDKPGDLLQIDSVVLFINGVRRYIVAAIDVTSGFAFAHAYTKHTSNTTKDFFQKLEKVIPYRISHIQTDNGSEFLHRFHDNLNKKNIIHFFNYPRRPTQNAYIERFNRTIQEEFADYHLNELAYSIDKFNRRMAKWLLWYNIERPHQRFNQISPLQYLINNYGFSHMLWTRTKA